MDLVLGTLLTGVPFYLLSRGKIEEKFSCTALRLAQSRLIVWSLAVLICLFCIVMFGLKTICSTLYGVFTPVVFIVYCATFFYSWPGLPSAHPVMEPNPETRPPVPEGEERNDVEQEAAEYL